jgi:hypothetical protein
MRFSRLLLVVIGVIIALPLCFFFISPPSAGSLESHGIMRSKKDLTSQIVHDLAVQQLRDWKLDENETQTLAKTSQTVEIKATTTPPDTSDYHLLTNLPADFQSQLETQLIYWSTRKPKIARDIFPMPSHDKYVSFEVDGGGWNNIRMVCMCKFYFTLFAIH